ncbi:glycosyltransferase family 1 protein [uncultured Ilyobacter sp.]|uniref:glycosyltransferase family 1 protein n=1 Tax=uncultured Ilyobacter sp. TaxID=544433 RepID=UPI002AA7556A|nr:glycosyltransferase family 1 protein [uncultured Ilyobacter sp.]
MSEPIRVLHVFGRLDSGGAESRTMDIYRQIDRCKVQFDFAIHTEDKCFFTDEVKSLGGKIYSFPRFNGKNYFQYRKKWNEFFKKHPEYQIVHGHQTNTGFVYLKEAEVNNVPVRIAHSRNSNKENLIKKYICKLSKLYATNLFAVSKIAGISEFGKNAVNKGFVKILPNAINAKKYSFDTEKRREKRSEFGIKDELLIIHIGRFHPQKNHTFLLDIFNNILKNEPDAKLLLVGDGTLKSEIVKQISEHQINKSVIIAGTRTDVPELLQAADILLFPSLFEGLPGVVLESQAAGLPCIISDTITEEVKVTDLVEYVPLEHSAEVWATKVLGIDYKFKRRNTYEEITEKGYDIESVAKWYEDFYRMNIK